jgi:hypothetical protein
MPIVLATQEAEIRRIEVPGQLGQIVWETLSQKNPTQKKRLVEWLKKLEELPSKREALSSNPSTAKQTKKHY